MYLDEKRVSRDEFLYEIKPLGSDSKFYIDEDDFKDTFLSKNVLFKHRSNYFRLCISLTGKSFLPEINISVRAFWFIATSGDCSTFSINTKQSSMA